MRMGHRKHPPVAAPCTLPVEVLTRTLARRRASLTEQEGLSPVALHALPEAENVPWHRVVNAKGTVSPRAEPGWDGVQRQLLEREGIAFDDTGRIALASLQWQPRSRCHASMTSPISRFCSL